MPGDIESLFRAHRARVYRWAHAMCRNHADSLDAVQEVFLRMMRSTPVFADEPAAIGWLRRTTSSVVVDAWRTRRSATDAVARLRLANANRNSAPDVSSASIALEATDHLRAAMVQLSEQQRLVILAKVFDQMTFEQVAAELEIAIPTAKTHYLRALAALRDRLSVTADENLSPRMGSFGERHELPRISRATA